MTDAPRTILIVDDDRELCGSLSEKLTEAGFSVSFALTGKEGEDIALADHPDLILLDILLPDKSGHDVLKAIRKDEWGASALVIFLTNVDSSESSTDAMTLGLNEYLIKSDLSLPSVVARITKKLDERLGGSPPTM